MIDTMSKISTDIATCVFSRSIQSQMCLSEQLKSCQTNIELSFHEIEYLITVSKRAQCAATKENTCKYKKHQQLRRFGEL